jgi:methanethiol oxidase
VRARLRHRRRRRRPLRQGLHFWDLSERRLEQTLDLGEQGLVPLELGWLHDPDAEQGFVGATLASNIVRFHRSNGSFRADPVIEVENEELEGWPLSGGVPGLITDLVLSMDDRFLYLSNWLQATCANTTSPIPPTRS